MTNTPTNLRSDFRIVKVDITKYVDDPELVEHCGGKVYEVHLFDACVHHHCCELTPSYDFNFLYHVPESLPDGDALCACVQEQLDDLDQYQDLGSYVHVRSINLDKTIQVGTVTQEEWAKKLEDGDDPEELYAEVLEEYVEYCQCNHYV